MKAWNRICKKLLLPPGWVMAILAGFSAAALPVVFLRERTNTRRHTPSMLCPHTP